MTSQGPLNEGLLTMRCGSMNMSNQESSWVRAEHVNHFDLQDTPQMKSSSRLKNASRNHFPFACELTRCRDNLYRHPGMHGSSIPPLYSSPFRQAIETKSSMSPSQPPRFIRHHILKKVNPNTYGSIRLRYLSRCANTLFQLASRFATETRRDETILRGITFTVDGVAHRGTMQ